MARNLGKDIDFDFYRESSNYDSVVFTPGKPVLHSELNLAQELSLAQSRLVASSVGGSGWLSKRPPSFVTSAAGKSSFFTQDPSGALPEVALVNGWPIKVSGTGTSLGNANLVDLSGPEMDLGSGARVDGVFLEAWRGLISDELEGITTPFKTSELPAMNSIHVVGKKLAFAVGQAGSMLRYVGINTWDTIEVPTSVDLLGVAFNQSGSVGVAVGESGEVLVTRDSGVTWTRSPSGVQVALHSAVVVTKTVSNSSATSIFIVGDSGTILKSTDMGTTFDQVSSAAIGSSDILKIKHLPGTDYLYLCGANLLISRYNMASGLWESCQANLGSLESFNTKPAFKDIGFLGGLDVIVAGEYNLVLRALDGTTFTPVQVSPETDSQWGTSGPVINDYSPNRMVIDSILVADPGRTVLKVAVSAAASPYADSVVYTVVEGSSPRVKLELYSRGVAVGIPFDTPLAGKTPSAVQAEINAYSQTLPGSLVSLNLFNASFGVDTLQSLSGLASSTRDRAILPYKISPKVYLFTREIDTGNTFTLAMGNAGISFFATPTTAGLGLLPNPIRCSASIDSTKLFIGGVDAYVATYDASTDQSLVLTPTGTSVDWDRNSHDLYRRVSRRVYNNGNILSASSLNPSRDSIHPAIGLEISHRTQIQYRIRTVAGVDHNTFPDAGLGSQAALSQGPNGTQGSPFMSMAPINGDRNLYRAPCKNTVDGFTYAIPMFLAFRENKAPYNYSVNINGSTVDANIRPDGRSYGDMGPSNVLDIRKTIKPEGTSLELLLESVLNGELQTTVSYSLAAGGQYGTTLLTSDVVPALHGNAGSTVATGTKADSKVALASSLRAANLNYTAPNNGTWSTLPANYTTKATLASTGAIIDVKSYVYVGLGTDNMRILASNVFKGILLDNPYDLLHGVVKISLVPDIANSVATSAVLIKSGAKFSVVGSQGSYIFLVTEDCIAVGGVATLKVWDISPVKIDHVVLGTEPAFGGIFSLVSDIPEPATSSETVTLDLSLGYNYPLGNSLSLNVKAPVSVKVFSPGSEVSGRYFNGTFVGKPRPLYSEVSSIDASIKDSAEIIYGNSGFPIVKINLLAKVAKDISGISYLALPSNLGGHIISVVSSIFAGTTELRVGKVSVEGAGSLPIKVGFATGFAPQVDSIVKVVAYSYSKGSSSFLEFYDDTDVGDSLAAFRSPNVAEFSYGSRGVTRYFASKLVRAQSNTSVAGGWKLPVGYSASSCKYPTVAGSAGDEVRAWVQSNGTWELVMLSEFDKTTFNFKLPGYDINSTTVLFPITENLSSSTTSESLSGQQAVVSYRGISNQTISLGASAKLRLVDVATSGIWNAGSSYVDSSIDPRPYFHSLLPVDPAAGFRDTEFIYTEGGVNIPGAAKAFEGSLQVLGRRITPEVTISGQVVDSRGRVCYTSLKEGTLGVELSGLPSFGPRKQVLPLYFVVSDETSPFHGELVLGVLAKATVGTDRNKLELALEGSSFGGYLSLFRIPGFPKVS